ncbi:MAG: response regulator [Acetobacteraceae bacterium]|nr:response regulator [Acetobacteraceae bacterium]
MQRILVVEDDPLVSETILCVLEEHYQVTLASSASAAASRLRDEAFDLVLLDCILPGGGVADLVAHAERRGAVVVLTSGDPGQIEAQGGGRRPFLAKPFSLNRLLDVLATARAERFASLPAPGCLPQVPTHGGPAMPPSPAARSVPLARRAWPAVLNSTAWAAALHFAAATLFALTRAPAAAAAAPRPD